MRSVVGATLQQSLCFFASSVGMNAASHPGGLVNNWLLHFLEGCRLSVQGSACSQAREPQLGPELWEPYQLPGWEGPRKESTLAAIEMRRNVPQFALGVTLWEFNG